MYEEHFQLNRKPFAVTPDPAFFYAGASHREALASLQYGISECRGLMTLIGEVGTGKSTVIRALLEKLDVGTETMLVTHTTLTKKAILAQILEELDIKTRWLTLAQMIDILRKHLLTVAQNGQPPPLLIIDEAQNLTVPVMEEVRLLTNLETAHNKLLQVILAGQPELQEKLNLTRLRQLRQRIAVRARLEPLSFEETRQYVEHRLNVAGRSSRLFKSRALNAIWANSGGTPRLINIICEQSLVYAFARAAKKVDEPTAKEAMGDLGLLTDSSDLEGRPETDLRSQFSVAQARPRFGFLKTIFQLKFLPLYLAACIGGFVTGCYFV